MSKVIVGINGFGRIGRAIYRINHIRKLFDITIINDTADFAIPYLCNNKFIKSKFSHEPLFLKKMKPNEYQRIIVEKKLNENEIYLKEFEIVKGNIDNLVTSTTTNMKLLKVFVNAHGNPNMYGDIHLHGMKK